LEGDNNKTSCKDSRPDVIMNYSNLAFGGPTTNSRLNGNTHDLPFPFKKKKKRRRRRRREKRRAIRDQKIIKGWVPQKINLKRRRN
jgi:hypothetical protein